LCTPGRRSRASRARRTGRAGEPAAAPATNAPAAGSLAADSSAADLPTDRVADPSPEMAGSGRAPLILCAVTLRREARPPEPGGGLPVE
jgi:hypothetical protein